ncbi:MAG: STAS domain-containing protein [Clostridia bacterium]|nr:STAS domain-containing protein [Clostridia bacterium]
MIKQNGSFTHQQTAEEMVVTLLGDIDHHSAVQLRADLDRLLYGERPARLTLDLSSVEFMDSSGLGLILGRLNLMQEIGGEMWLADPTPRVERVLHLAGLERILPIVHKKSKGGSR